MGCLLWDENVAKLIGKDDSGFFFDVFIKVAAHFTSYIKLYPETKIVTRKIEISPCWI